MLGFVAIEATSQWFCETLGYQVVTVTLHTTI